MQLVPRLVLALSVSILACRGVRRTEAAFARSVAVFKGSPVQAVVDQWGYPTGSFVAPNDRTVYFYESRSTVQTTSMTHVWVVPQLDGTVRSTSVTTGGDVRAYWCKVFFEVTGPSKRIAKVSFDGNDCLARDDSPVSETEKNDL